MTIPEYILQTVNRLRDEANYLDNLADQLCEHYARHARIESGDATAAAVIQSEPVSCAKDQPVALGVRAAKHKKGNL